MAFLAFALVAGLAADGSNAGSFFTPHTFSADEGCRWTTSKPLPLRMNAHYIARPEQGQDRDAWLAALRTYREDVRNGAEGQALDLAFDGVRAWTRASVPLAKALALKPGDMLRVEAEAQAIEGNSTLCVAFDIHARDDDRKVDWTGVQGTMAVPQNGDWHTVVADVPVPEFDAGNAWLRPIVGMDATHDPAPGRVRIRDLRLSVDDPARTAAVADVIAAQPAPGLDRSIYDRPALAWAQRAFTCHFTFLYDKAFYDNGYKLDAFLDDGEREFGGYDILVLWQGYPRLGLDQRNQFDMYRDLPGGLDGVRDVVHRAQARGVRVFIDYNPWDTGTRREGVPDQVALAELVAAIDADGIFLDTMLAAPDTLRARIDAARPGVVFAPEGHPAIGQLAQCNASWAQWLDDPEPPGMLHLKWIEPRHVQHQIHRWDTSHRAEIESAFFNGSGMLVWENVFDTYNPWPAEDRRLWKRAVGILRHYAEHFTSDAWDPFYPTLAPGLHAHRWPQGDVQMFTLLNAGEPLTDAPLLAVPAPADADVYDLWTGQPAVVEREGDTLRIRGDIERLGCYVVLPKSAVDDALRQLLARQQEFAASALNPARNGALSVVEPRPVAPTQPADIAPQGMVHVPGATVRMHTTHMRRECGCYPDPGTLPEEWKRFLWGSPFDETLEHDYTVDVKPFHIDEAEVSNAEFHRFLVATGYAPEHRENLVKHWGGDAPPAELADHPVVYVSLDDARAYAEWAGKRLPTEAEWRLAAQGTDGREWPWGDEFDAARCNTTGDRTLPVRSLPEGRSPCGCYHMSGNVWEWTESERDDGHTRFAILCGGSYFNAEGSIWYVAGGPLPVTTHAKMLLLWPGLDRCATVGFRCVADAAE